MVWLTIYKKCPLSMEEQNAKRTMPSSPCNLQYFNQTP
ncbi:MAG: hypothetical protein ACI9NN_000564 [Bacteroidia bacterium]